MVTLARGSAGKDVKHLQTLLRRYDRHVAVDGVYGPQTERAVRLAQRRMRVYPPDGIAGPYTLAALDHLQAAHPHASTRPAPVTPRAKPVQLGNPGPLTQAVASARAQAVKGPMPAGTASPAVMMRTSAQGRLFIIQRECQRGVSNHLHHPSAGSGVTIGPGYDMKDRTADDVATDLGLINVPPAVAAKAAQGATLSGDAADRFVAANKTLLNLTEQQEAALLDNIVDRYESRVQRSILVPLHQYEFDALVSFAYNPGGGWSQAIHFVNMHKAHEAMVVVSQQVYSKHKLMRGLVDRRQFETRLFLYGEYR